ncbi:MAG: nucleoside triphosphate pyrophosphohydrolase [Hyphomicrobiaceae bacterium]
MAKSSKTEPGDLAGLLEIMAALRTPTTGCPWDLEQDFHSIAPYTIEEAYEVADAIERDDMTDLKDELGDLLFQVVYHARMAEEQGAFQFRDVVEGVTQKMLRRHPHVFGTDGERAAGPAPDFWEKSKAKEREEKSRQRGRGNQLLDDRQHLSLLDGVPNNLPSLTRALKLQNRAAKVGFDWPSLSEVFDKLSEELAELKDAIARGDRSDIHEEFGDLIFVLANVARHLNVDPESSLRDTNQKFTRRFQRVESWLGERGRSPQDSSLEEMDALWNAAKKEERGVPKD